MPDTYQRDITTTPVPAEAQRPDFQRLFESAPGLYLALSTDFTIMAVSDAYLQATLTERVRVIGRCIFDVFPDNPNDAGATGVRNLSESLGRVVRLRQADTMAVQRYDIRRSESEGGGFEERFWSPVNLPVFDADGELAYIIHRVEDVTEFIRLKQHDSEQERLAATLLDRSEQMEAEIFQRAQEIQDANRQLRRAHAHLEERVRERTAELAKANEALQAEIEQSRRIEEQLRQAQKMEAVGTLAGGVAHDFNNLLTIISGYSEILLDNLPAADELRDLVEQIRKAGDRAAGLTRQLLAFSRQQVLEFKILDLNAIVADTGKMLGRVIGEDILLTTVLAPDLGRVKCDPGQVEQIILNLAVNARDAMPQGGRLTLETRNVDLDATYAMSHLEVRPGRYVMLAVSDTGCGMDEAVRSRIFEPFFTTKETGKGTGLGLAMVFGIVKQSGGTIWVYSEPGHGSTFKIYLPLVTEEDPVAAAPARRTTPTGTETILVVEDDNAVRALTVFILKNFGYHVLPASSGAEALKLSQQHNGPIDLLISDVVMPEMGGGKVADAMRDARPGIKVLYLSGYTDDAIVRHGILHEQVAFLQKPFTPLSLAQKVRSVLEMGSDQSTCR